MLKPVFRLLGSAKRLHLRPFSTTTIPYSNDATVGNASKSSASSVFMFQRVLGYQTDDPLWHLQYKLKYPDAIQTTTRKNTKALTRSGVTFQDFDFWRRVIYAPHLDDAVSILREIESSQSNLRAETRAPTWLILYLVCHKVKTPEQASYSLISVVNSYLSEAPSHLQPPILIFTTLALSSFNVMHPMRGIIQIFLTIPLADPWLYFNLFLLAIARFPRSNEAADLVVTILEAMKSRQVNLRSQTYKVLLADRFVTMQLTKVLRAQMMHEGFAPTAAHFESYLRMFAKDGAIHDACKYLDAIRALALEEDERDVPYGPNVDSAEEGSVQPVNTLYIGNLDNRASAFQYLGKLLRQDKRSLSKPTVSHFQRVFIALTRREQRKRFVFRRRCKRGVDIFDWTAALTVAVRDKSTTSEQLIRLLQRSYSMTHKFKPTVATYTVVLRGLIYRKDFQGAETVWTELRNTHLPLDDKALTVGLQLLTRIGKPHVAFALLEMVARRDETRHSRRQRGITTSTIALNEFMVSLMRIGRPDVVFKLWDGMETLYGVKPDNVTLNVLLKSARLASKLDDTLRGAWAEFVSFRTSRRQTQSPQTRQETVGTIEKTLGSMETGLVPYYSGQWKGEPAWQTARQLFKHIIFGNWPDLMHVKSPANAVRSSPSDVARAPMTELARGLTSPYSSSAHKDTAPPPPSYVEVPNAHPQIMLNDRCFFAYIQLLGLNSRASEIPLALAWMRTLDAQPSQGTLALALVFWGEVSLYAPLIESWAGGRARSEYARLVEWMRDWVGDERVPTEDHVGEWMLIVKRMRGPRQPFS